MKKIIWSILITVTTCSVYAQNTFPTSGNVGIGTTNPTFGQLSIAAPDKTVSSAISVRQNNSLGYGFDFALDQNVDGDGYFYGVSYNGKVNLMQFDRTNNIVSFNGGNVGIGTTSPGEKLSVVGNLAVIFDLNNPTLNMARIINLGYSNQTGAENWALRGVYQYGNGVSLNSTGGDLDLIKSMDGNTILATKTDGSPLGNVLIGKAMQHNSAYLLDVAGSVRANQITVNTTGADFVFEPIYKLMPLADVSKYINDNHHLPDIASSAEMQKEGVNLGGNQTKLLQKIEELTLYLIEQDKKLSEFQRQLDQQNKKNLTLEKSLLGLKVCVKKHVRKHR